MKNDGAKNPCNLVTVKRIKMYNAPSLCHFKTEIVHVDKSGVGMNPAQLVNLRASKND